MITKKITEWTQQEKTALLNAILDVYGTDPYVDIHVAGSRVWGAHQGTSDMDVIIWVNEPNVKVYLPFFSFRGIRISAYVETRPAGKLHRLCYVGNPHKPEGRDLPTYSLITNNIHSEINDGNLITKDVLWHIEHRKKFVRFNR